MTVLDIYPPMNLSRIFTNWMRRWKSYVLADEFTPKRAQGKRLDTRFSFVNLLLKSWILESRDITTEKDIVDSFCFAAVLVGKTALLFDGKNFVGPILPQKDGFKAITGVSETYEVEYEMPTPCVNTVSDITTPKIITKRKLSDYSYNVLHTIIKNNANKHNDCFLFRIFHWYERTIRLEKIYLFQHEHR